MILPRNLFKVLSVLLLVALCPVVARAVTLGNTPGDPMPLAPGQMLVSGNLNGQANSFDTLLAQFAPGYLSIKASDDNSSNLGGDLASGLSGLTLESDGAIFLGVSGIGNFNNDGLFNVGNHSHSQSGFYQLVFDYYDSSGAPLETVVLPSANSADSISPNEVDTFFIPGTAQRAGGTVDVNVDALAGPGSGNAIDFWLFNGLTPGASFQAAISLGEFASGLGVYSGVGGTLLDFDLNSEGNGLSLLSGVVPGNGEIVFGVTGSEDASASGFAGEHSQYGSYTLELSIGSDPVPEPASALLLGFGLASCLLSLRRRSLGA